MQFSFVHLACILCLPGLSVPCQAEARPKQVLPRKLSKNCALATHRSPLRKVASSDASARTTNGPYPGREKGVGSILKAKRRAAASREGTHTDWRSSPHSRTAAATFSTCSAKKNTRESGRGGGGGPFSSSAVPRSPDHVTSVNFGGTGRHVTLHVGCNQQSSAPSATAIYVRACMLLPLLPEQLLRD